jgi:amino acid adenylation domain-containing protein/non-ribosomal peptide synthase protein (TIGR01720 family)
MMIEACVDDTLHIEPDEVYVFPASFGQQRLWFLDRFEPNSPYYNIPAVVRLTGALDAAVLEQALNEVVRRHEALRTTFDMLDGEVAQLIAPAVNAPLPVIDLRSLPETDREAAAMRRATAEARQPFDLTRGPLLRAQLLRLNEREHIALFTLHHIIADGWSINVLISELATLYAAFAADRPSPLPELPIQYADFAEWQRSWLQGAVLAEQLDYWKNQLANSPTVLELPTDRPRPAVQTSRGSSRSLRLSSALTQDLNALSRREHCTLFMTLLAAFQTLLHRYTGVEDICVGTPIANRNRAEVEALIGLFINTLVMRTDLSGDPSFRQLLQRVRETTLGAYAHQDVPFEKLVDVLQPVRDMSHSPLFQVMFILQNAPLKAQQLPGLTLNLLDVDSGTATFDLTLSMSETREGLDASIEYNTDLFDAATIDRFLQHFDVLLHSLVADPAAAISELAWLPAAERQQLLIAWNATAASYSTGDGAHHLFEAQAARAPDNIAVVWQNERLTYAVLNRRANQLAHYLRRLGIGPETPVAICMERSVEMILSVLGVLKAGGAYVPIDPLYPADRIAFMLEDSQAPVLLTQAPLAALFKHPQTICVDADWDAIALESDANPIRLTTPDNLAYVIYTSGSTGRAKGALITHRNLVNVYRAWEVAYELQSVSSHLQMANFAFDVFSGDFVRALCSAGKLVLCPREFLLDAPRLYDLMRRERVDCAEFVPAVLRGLIQYLDQTQQTLDFMRLLLCGSDSWYVEEYRHFKRFCGPRTRLINSFGLTEATIDSSYYEAAALEAGADQVVPIGRPFPNMQLYVLDQHLQPMPIGVPGELYVGGLGVARGYLHQPELTTKRFIPNPFQSEIQKSKIYKTGDRARVLADGNLEFLGRMDFQVKIRGFRIEPGEIEATLGQHPAVQSAVVLVKEAAPNDQRLAAYVASDRQPAPTAGELRQFAQDRLPEYMIPAAFVVLDAMPLMANGKIDRNALPAPDWSRRDLADEYAAPRTPIEEALVKVWQQVLGVRQIGVHDNFFQLGGHSLLATQLISRIRTAFKVDLPLRNVFEAPTVAGLASLIDVAQRAEAGVSVPPMRRAPRDQTLPLSFAQQRLWFLDQLEPNSPTYNLPEALRLHGPLNLAALERSLNEIVRRHEVLRTTFATLDGQARQIIAPQLTLPLSIDDLRSLPPAEREAEAQRLMKAAAQQPFDLAIGPLLRARALRLADDDHIVLLTLHHIAGDDWSTNVLLQEVSALYDAFTHDRPSPLPELPLQYADFAHWQRAWLQGAVLEKQLGYWQQQLRGAPPLLPLPTDRPRPPVQTFNGAYHTFVLPPQLSLSIRALCQREGVTPFMLLLAAFQTLLHRYTHSDDVSVGTPIANRNRAEIEGLIGFFVNTLVLRTDLSGEPSFREVLRRVREVSLGAYAHQDVPFEMIVEALQPKRDLSHSPLFQVMFVIQNAPQQRRAFVPGLTLSSAEAHSGTAKFDLTLFMMEEADDRLSGALEYNTDLFDAATMTRLLGHFETLLTGIVADPDQSIATLPLLTAAERRQLLIEWNDTQAGYPSQLCAHQLFEEQVARTPDASAVKFGETVLTYAELNGRANQLAHYLRQRAVGPETLVGICVERSIELIVGLLGVLKAGGAYVPIDPHYPAERIAYMLEDAQTPIVLTQERLVSSRQPSAVSNQQVLCLDSDWPLIAGESGDNPINETSPGHLAYVIYTSGSTGKPKGVMVIHRGLVNYLTWCRRAYPLAGGNGAPVHSSISFDLTVTAVFAPLIAGRCVHLLPDDLAVETLSDAVRAVNDFSLIKITPAHLQLLGQQLAPDQAAQRTRAFIIGGENLLVDHIAFWQRHAPGTQLINEYGPTETVVGCCVYDTPLHQHRSGSIPIGRPISNTQLYVLDKHLQPVPIGVTGELYIGGAGVARGYLNRPDLTEEKFLPNPFESETPARHQTPCGASVPNPESKIYKTGDLVRYLPDGNLVCLGRADFQVKIRGFRVELGEIETVLGQHPAVREAIAWVWQASGTQRLVAYIVPQNDDAPAAADLRAFLKEKLPEYMIPAAFVTLDSLPLTSNGKIDHAALPAPDQIQSESASTYVAPSTPPEQLLADIWAQVLGLRQVGIHDNFFELGGDSIMSIQVIARANQAGLQLTAKQLFEQPTIAGLAALANAGRTVIAEQGQVTGPVPLTPIQHWFFDHELSQRHHWNQSLMLEVQQPLDRTVLAQTISHLQAQHDALRLRFSQDENGWQASVADVDDTVPLTWIDLAEADDQSSLATHAARVQASLNLANGPLICVAYFAGRGAQADRLLIAAHHLVIDGVSWPILLEDFQTAYQQLAAGQVVRLPLKTSSFQQWAQRLQTYAQADQLRNEWDYWLAMPRDRPARLPLDYAASVHLNTEASAESVTVELSAAETQTLLRELPAIYRSEINAVLLTALTLALTEWTGTRTALIDLESHGREALFDDLDVSRTVGWFTSLYPVRLTLAETGAAQQHLLAIKDQLRGVPRHGLGYGVLRYLGAADVREQLRALPEAEVIFNYLGQMDQLTGEAAAFEIAREAPGPERSLRDQRTHLIDINGGIAHGCLQMEWTFSANLHRRETIERVAQSFSAALRSIIGSQSAEAAIPAEAAEFGWSSDDVSDILNEIGEVQPQ